MCPFVYILILWTQWRTPCASTAFKSYYKMNIDIFGMIPWDMCLAVRPCAGQPPALRECCSTSTRPFKYYTNIWHVQFCIHYLFPDRTRRVSPERTQRTANIFPFRENLKKHELHGAYKMRLTSQNQFVSSIVCIFLLGSMGIERIVLARGINDWTDERTTRSCIDERTQNTSFDIIFKFVWAITNLFGKFPWYM